MTNHAHRGIVGQAHAQALLGFIATIGDRDETRMLTVSHPYAAPMVKAHPASATGYARGKVEQRPIGDCIGTVEHPFRLAERARHRTRIEVVSADHDRRTKLTISHHLVEEEPCAITLTITKPADAGREPLKGDLFAGEGEPLL